MLLLCGSLGKVYWQQSMRVVILVHLHRVCSKAAPAFPRQNICALSQVPGMRMSLCPIEMQMGRDAAQVCHQELFISLWFYCSDKDSLWEVPKSILLSFPLLFFQVFSVPLYLVEGRFHPWLGIGGGLGPEWPKRLLVWGIAGTPDGALGVTCCFPAEMYDRTVNAENSIECTMDCPWAWSCGKAAEGMGGFSLSFPVCLVPHSSRTQYLSALSLISSHCQSSAVCPVLV